MGIYKSPPTLAGMVYGNLTVLGVAPKQGRYPSFECLCICGMKTVIRATNLRSGTSTSCGCSKYKSKNKTHGYSSHEYYPLWRGMIARCYNPKHRSYKDYGGRGITVVKEWLDSFEVFIKDIGLKPTDKHQLDRIRNNEGYGPNNHQWLTPRINSRNRRNNHLLEYEGELITLTEASERTGLSLGCLRGRILRKEPNIFKPVKDL